MLQYCCGQGDCDAAAPAASIADAHSQALQGNTTVVSLKFGDVTGLGESGKRSIEGLGEVTWQRSDHAYSRRADGIESETEPERPQTLSRSLHQKRDCTFRPTSDRVTEGGRQVKASDTQICNSPNGCSLMISVAVTEGYSINPTLTANLFSTISAAVGYTFTESKTSTVATTYTQTAGTNGYVSYIPTMNCWDGTFSGCVDRNGDDIVAIDPSTVFHACTPALRSDGSIDGTFSFVFA